MKKNNATLAVPKTVTIMFETGVGGGSIAVKRDDGALIDFWSGKQENSGIIEIFARSEQMLTANKIGKNAIGRVVVSKGPGSYTGIRNGWATALGLARSLRCAFTAVSVLEALTVLASSNSSGRIVAAVPFGKTQICRQEFAFEKSPQTIKYLSVPLVSQKNELVKTVCSQDFEQIILHGNLYAQLQAEKSAKQIGERRIINAGENLAILLGRYREQNINLQNEPEADNEPMRPMYVSENK